jgi:hypothetical protein
MDMQIPRQSRSEKFLHAEGFGEQVFLQPR